MVHRRFHQTLSFSLLAMKQIQKRIQGNCIWIAQPAAITVPQMQKTVKIHTKKPIFTCILERFVRIHPDELQVMVGIEPYICASEEFHEICLPIAHQNHPFCPPSVEAENRRVRARGKVKYATPSTKAGSGRLATRTTRAHFLPDKPATLRFHSRYDSE